MTDPDLSGVRSFIEELQRLHRPTLWQRVMSIPRRIQQRWWRWRTWRALKRGEWGPGVGPGAVMLVGGEERVVARRVSGTVLEIEHLPAIWKWSEFKKRNLKIAEDCTHLVRIAATSSRTYGSGWTRDRAREMGKPTEEILIDDRN